MRIVGNNPQLSRQTQGTASGAITGGKPVIVNTDGTVKQAASSVTISRASSRRLPRAAPSSASSRSRTRP